MSSAFYPQGMNSWNNRLPQGGYKTWKGRGLFSNPVTVTSTHIRPLTNNDPGNVFPTGFGLPRPIKHYRKGTVIPVPIPVLVPDPSNPAQYIEQSLIDYNVNRAVKSSLGSSLGGGNGGTGLISQLIDTPGSFIVKDNQPFNSNQYNDVGILNDPEFPETNKIDNACTTCEGIGGVSGWYPINNLTEKPEPNVTNPLLCCNQQRKARKRVLGANTNVKKNYYQTTDMYLYNRCQTFQQRQFNFIRGPIDQTILDLFLKYPFVTAKILEYSKPGDPLSIVNYYVAQCNPNFTIETAVEIAFINELSKSLLAAGYISQPIYLSLLNSTSVQQFISQLQGILTTEQYKIVIEYLYQLAANPYNGSVVAGPSNPKGCAQVFYKPNNPQFAQQGGVSSSTRILKLNVDTISTAAAGVRKLKGANLAAQIAGGQPVNTPFIYKFKAPTCQASTYSGNPFFFQGQHQNKKICSKKTGQDINTFVSVYQHSAGNYIGSTQP
jgi:hypothetical protein